MARSGEYEVNSSGSDATGILVVPRILHIAYIYKVTYRCVPYNMLGDGADRIVIVDIQGMSV